ncbi:cilia- and flagella-associated protein 47 [Macrotis lagotis]|uniref:cilia- and flagella-associated protein 47 n=1 Tax=Macrotis lagotis TaxID=92651 RepID=UPI003D69F688
MEKTVLSLRICPPRVLFANVQVGKVYSTEITVQNIGRSNKKIRFLGPRDPQFKLNLNTKKIQIATGLHVTATVTYQPVKEEDSFDKICILVGKRNIEIPLFGVIPCCDLEIESNVNFGTIIANSKEICKSINVTNHGTISGSFNIDYEGNLPITIQPTSGVVDPKSSKNIKICMCTDKPRIVSELAKVSLQDGKERFLKIEAHVVQQIIELLDKSEEKSLKCIQFGSVFFGTSKIEHAILYNNSPEQMSWVAVMEHEAVGEELGTNLQQGIEDTLQDLSYISRMRNIDVNTFIACIPNEGTLLPYEKSVITFCFSPKLYDNGKKHDDLTHRQDYALFLRFEAIESKDTFFKAEEEKATESHHFHKVELALTGSGLQVYLSFVPGKILNFTPCSMGQYSEILCSIHNHSKSLPVSFSFHKLAHFKITPEKGKIAEEGVQNVLFSFVPHQLGTFKVKQLMDILGLVAEDDLQSVKVKPFHQIQLSFTSICKPTTKRIEMKIIPGITPLITNATGQYVVDETGEYKNFAPVAMLKSRLSTIHNHQLTRPLKKNVQIAFPNDRWASLRSGDPQVEIRTIFTNVPRYNYVDTDYTYTKEEEIRKKENKHYYSNLTLKLAKRKMKKMLESRAFRLSDNEIDIGMEPEERLNSPHLSITQLFEEMTEPVKLPIRESSLLSTQNLVAKEAESLQGNVVNHSLVSPQAREECNLMLTPKQLHQVVIGPSVLNFGDICVNCLCTKPVHVINNLPLYIVVRLEIDHEELKNTNPLSYVVPPASNTSIPIVFEKTTLGTFWKSFSFTINNIPSGNILVKAEVMPVALELSTKELVLRPTRGFLAKTGYRGTVRLYNHQNCAAKFKWKPLIQENGIAFYIRPAKGTVEGYSALDCEVTWEATYSSPEKGQFFLQVCNGNTVRLDCSVKIIPAKVVLLSHHILFENCSQGLTTTKKTVLQNVGLYHAYFKICDQELLPFIKITPSHGIIPVGGLTSLDIACTPYFSERFDTKAKVIIRHGKELDLRIGGTIEIVDVVISLNLINFQGVYVGSKKVIPFLLNNKGITRARVEFDLSNYKDFTLEFKDHEVYPGVYTAEVPFHLKDDPVCYRLLTLKGTVRAPKLTFDPPFVFLTPVPLGVKTGIDINIIPQNYFRKSSVNAQVPTIKLYDGVMIDVLSVDFPNGKVIEVSPDGINTELISHISFKSMKPVSFSADVLFLDEENNWFEIQITAVAENCILTVYPYLAYHFDDQNIMLKEGIDVPCENISLQETEKQKSEYEENEYLGMKQGQYFFPDEDKKEYLFFEKVVTAVQTWFSLFGWSQGPNPISVPESVRRAVSKGELSLSSSTKNQINSNSDFTRYTKTIYDMLYYLSGQMLPGVSTTQTLPIDDTERVIHLHWLHSTLLTFLKTQGACLPYILPEFLLEPNDYKKWIKIKAASKMESENAQKSEKYTLIIEDCKFEAMSKRVWTDVLLQTYKVLVLSRIVPLSSSNKPTINIEHSPKINPEFSSSNIYSKPERTLLSWMNTNYENTRCKIWKSCDKGLPPLEKWIVNFDKDLLDGLILAAQLAAYCPFLIPTHFVDMYTSPHSPEQCLHNCLIVVNALREIDLNIDIQAIDICDPNPVLMLMFCVYLYENLPSYLPSKIVDFPCSLHTTVVRQILLENTSIKNLVYNARIIGWDAADFSLPEEYKSVITIPPRDQVYINVAFTSRFIHPAEAILMLISRMKSGKRGTTTTFALKAEVTKFKAMEIISCKTPCYEWKEIIVDVKNPFHTDGEFSINLVESSTFVYQTEQLNELNQSKDENLSYGINFMKIENENNELGQGNILNTSIKCSFMKEFFCQVQSVYLEAKGTSSIYLHFLPFDLNKRYCVIIFSNYKIGEFLYIVEGTSAVPLPSRFLPVNNSSIMNYNHPPDEDLSKDDPILHLKCDLHNFLELELKLPLVNEARAKALVFSAHQQMSSLEYERRKITGTLDSSSVRAVIALLGLTKLETRMLFHNAKSKSILYTTELSLPEYFDIPKKIYIPSLPQNKLKAVNMEAPQKLEQADYALLPLRFVPLTAGRYPCFVLLKSSHDIRLFSIECVVNANCPEAKLQFETPAFEALTQDIPISNQTQTKWKCIVTIKGDWFYGPSVLYVKSGETAYYPLTFKPILECEVTGTLILKNKTDGVEQIFELKGLGKKPLPLDHAVIDCQVGKMTKKPIIVPNYTNNLLTYKVTSDLPIVWGCPRITIEPDNMISYILHICTWKRGTFKGAVSFVAEDTEDIHEKNSEESLQKWLLDTTESLANKESAARVKVWFFLEINSSPAPPVDTIEVNCPVLDSIGIEISITNPKQSELHLDVILTNPSLSGESSLVLEPNEKITYIVKYSPKIIGSTDESVVFQPQIGIEFWYLLKLTSGSPKPTTMPEISCELGKKAIQFIPLVNSTHETLELTINISNPVNFLLHQNKKSLLVVPPYSTTEMPIQFYPSALGRAKHQASIILHCRQLDEWVFHLSGIGLIPLPLKPVTICTYIGRHLSVIIPFRNPTTEHLLVTILLKDKFSNRKLPASFMDCTFTKYSGFSLTLKKTQEIPLPPNGKLDIPVLFVPHIMKLYEAMLIVEVVRENGEYWPYDNEDELGPGLESTTRTENGDICNIRWNYPIQGIPEALPPKTYQASISGRARERVEETIQVLLTDVVFESPEQRELMVIPKKTLVEDDQMESVNDDLPEVHEFQYEIQFESELMKSNLESCIGLYLVSKERNIENGVIVLVFSIVFTPKKPMRSVITLVVQCSTDGIWKFPITLIANVPEVDDVINIEGIGLFKDSAVGFRLRSQTRFPESFTAYFLPGSDRQFFVKPQMGELLPLHTAGTLITVGFKPEMYSRRHQATLVIQTENIYWMYQINGLPPHTVPPTNVPARIDCINNNLRTISVHQRNFLQENAKLITTGVSSTIKGAPLVSRKK